MKKIYTTLEVSDMIDTSMLNNSSIKDITINTNDGFGICITDFNVTTDIDKLYCDNIVDTFDTGVIEDPFLRDLFVEIDKDKLKDQLYTRKNEFISYDNKIETIEDIVFNMEEE